MTYSQYGQGTVVAVTSGGYCTFIGDKCMIGMPGTIEIVVIAFILVLVFGKRIAQGIGGLGHALGEFKRGVTKNYDKNQGL
ncbi:MAG: twin-arginine translocase TatA/TatE family subunit [Deltaproteobacteria bacterium]|nr:twin-arginine translocase TatA/TatE family subunit [Deltaproteobacteria bacterium]